MSLSNHRSGSNNRRRMMHLEELESRWVPAIEVTTLLENTNPTVPYPGSLREAVTVGASTQSATRTITFNEYLFTDSVGTLHKPSLLALGNIDAKGGLDVLSMSDADASYALATNNFGNGTLTGAIKLESTLANTRALEVGRLDNDVLDDFVALQGSNAVIYLGKFGNIQDPSKKGPIVVDLGTSATTGLILADMNADSKLDVATALTGPGGGVLIAFGDVSGGFGSPVNIATNMGGITGLAQADVNGDGFTDLLTINGTGNVETLLRTAGVIPFSKQVSVISSVGGALSSVAVANLNADSYADAVVVDSTGTKLTVLMGQKDGSFAVATSLSVPANALPGQPRLVDVTNDGRPDLIVPMLGINKVHVYQGYGDATFQSSPLTVDVLSPSDVRIADMTGDSMPDLVVASRDTKSFAIFKINDTTRIRTVDTTNAPVALAVGAFDSISGNDIVSVTGQYSSSNPLTGGGFIANIGGVGLPLTADLEVDISNNATSAMNFIQPANLTHDGKLDYVGVNAATGTVQSFLGQGDGTFKAGNAFKLGQTVIGLVTGDFLHLDGQTDVATAVRGTTGQIEVLAGSSTATFGGTPAGTDRLTITLPLGVGNLIDLAAGDVNGDARTDLVALSGNGNIITVPRDALGTGFDQSNIVVTTGNGAAERLVLGDLNGDGRVDAVVVASTTYQLRIYFGLASGGFSAQSSITLIPGALPDVARLGDVDGNGTLDLVVSLPGIGQLAVFAGKGDGTFATAYHSLDADNVSDILLTDVTNDGRTDIVAGLKTNHAVAIFQYSATQPNLAASVSTGAGLVSIAIGAFDGKGGNDVLGVTGNFNAAVPLTGGALIANPGNTALVSSTALAISSKAFATAALDIVQPAILSQDAKTDLIGLNRVAGFIQPLMGNGDGTFDAGSKVSLGNSVPLVGLVTGDFNSDGFIDAATAYSGINGQIALVTGTKSGSFNAKLTTINLGLNNIVNLIARDVNGDGLLDIVALTNDGKLATLIQGTVGFDTSPVISVSTGKGDYLAIADLNGDGKNDVVMIDSSADIARVFKGAGDGTFTEQGGQALPVGSKAGVVRLGDLDGDGKVDLVVVLAATDQVAVYRGLGNYSFFANPNLLGAKAVGDLQLADITGDGRLDVVASLTTDQKLVSYQFAPQLTIAPVAFKQGVIVLNGAVGRLQFNNVDNVDVIGPGKFTDGPLANEYKLVIQSDLGILNVSISSGGGGFRVGDRLVQDRDEFTGGAVFEVKEINDGSVVDGVGSVLAVEVVNPGSNRTLRQLSQSDEPGMGKITAVSPSTGIGLVLNVDTGVVNAGSGFNNNDILIQYPEDPALYDASKNEVKNGVYLVNSTTSSGGIATVNVLSSGTNKGFLPGTMKVGALNTDGLTNHSSIDTTLAVGIQAGIMYDASTETDVITSAGQGFKPGDLLVQDDLFPTGGRVYRVETVGAIGDLLTVSLINKGYDGLGPKNNLNLSQNSAAGLSRLTAIRGQGINFVLDNGGISTNGVGYQVGDYLVQGPITINSSGVVIKITSVDSAGGVTGIDPVSIPTFNLSQTNPPGSTNLTFYRNNTGNCLEFNYDRTINSNSKGFGYNEGDILLQGTDVTTNAGGAVFKVAAVDSFGGVTSLALLEPGNNVSNPINIQQSIGTGPQIFTPFQNRGVNAEFNNISGAITKGGYGYKINDLLVQDIVGEEGGSIFRVNSVGSEGQIIGIEKISLGYYKVPPLVVGILSESKNPGLDHITLIRNYDGYGQGAIVSQNYSLNTTTQLLTVSSTIKTPGFGYKVGNLLVQGKSNTGNGGAVYRISKVGNVGQIIEVQQLYDGIPTFNGKNAIITYNASNKTDLITRGGNGFRVGDKLVQDSGALGSGGRIYSVTSVDTTGKILGINVDQPGYNGVGPTRNLTLDQNASPGATHLTLTAGSADMTQFGSGNLNNLNLYGKTQDSAASLQVGGIASGLVQQQMQSQSGKNRLSISGIEFGAARGDTIVQGPGNLVIDNSLFRHFNSLSEGDFSSNNYIYVQQNSSNLAVTGSTFLNSNNSAIDMYGSGTLDIASSLFRGNSLWAVEYAGSRLTIDNSSFIANGSIGGVLSIGAKTTVNNSLFLDQLSAGKLNGQQGSALMIQGGTAVVSDSYFGSNISNGNQIIGNNGGAAILALGGASLTVNKSLFVNNRIDGINDMMHGGGAIYVDTGLFSITSSGFENNSVAITDYQNSASPPDILVDYVSYPDKQPSPRYSGGGAVYSGGSTSINASWFSGNSVESNVDFYQLNRGPGAPTDPQYSGGGALYLASTGNATFQNSITNSTFTDNQVIQVGIKKDMNRSGKIFYPFTQYGSEVFMIQKDSKALGLDIASGMGASLVVDPYGNGTTTRTPQPLLTDFVGKSTYILSTAIAELATNTTAIANDIEPDILFEHSGQIHIVVNDGKGNYLKPGNALNTSQNISLTNKKITCFDAFSMASFDSLGNKSFLDLLVGSDDGMISLLARNDISNINSNRFENINVGAVARLPDGLIPKYIKVLYKDSNSDGSTPVTAGINVVDVPNYSTYALVVCDDIANNNTVMAFIKIKQGKKKDASPNGANFFYQDTVTDVIVISRSVYVGKVVDFDINMSRSEIVLATEFGAYVVPYNLQTFGFNRISLNSAYNTSPVGGVCFVDNKSSNPDVVMTFKDEQMIRYWSGGRINQTASRETDVSDPSFGGRPTKIRVGNYLNGFPAYVVGLQGRSGFVLVDYTKNVDSSGRGLTGGAILFADGRNISGDNAVEVLPFSGGTNDTTLTNVTIVRNSVVNQFANINNHDGGPDSGSIFGDFDSGSMTMTNSVNLANVGIIYPGINPYPNNRNNPVVSYVNFNKYIGSGGSLNSTSSNLYNPATSYLFNGGAAGDLIESDAQANHDFMPIAAEEIAPIVGLSTLLGGGTPVRYQSGIKTIAISTLSPAVDSGSNSVATTVTKDARGLSRLVGSHIDMGAYEVQTRTVLSVVSPTLRPAEPANGKPNQYVLIGYGETTALNVLCFNAANEVIRGVITGRVDLIRPSDLAVLGSAMFVPLDANDPSKGSMASIFLNTNYDSILDSGVNSVFLRYVGNDLNGGSQSAPFDLLGTQARVGVTFMAPTSPMLAGSSIDIKGVVETPLSVADLTGTVELTITGASPRYSASTNILIDTNDSSRGNFSFHIDGANFNYLGNYSIEISYKFPNGFDSKFKYSLADSSPPATIRVVKQPAITFTIPALPLLRTDSLTLKATVTPPITTGFNDPTPLDGKVEFLREDGSVFGTAVLSGTPAFGPVDYILTLANTNSPAFNMPSAPNNLLTARYIPGTNPYLGAVSAPQPLNYITLATTANVALSSGSAVRFYGEPVDVVSTVGGVLASPSPGLSTVELRNNGIAIPGVPALPYIVGQNSYAFSLGLLDPAVYNLASRYSGDGFNYGGSPPPVTPLAITINPAATTLGLSWSGSRGVSANGSPLTISVNLGTSSPLSGLATKLSGSVVFYETQIGVPSSKRQVGVPQAIDANGLVAPFTFIPTSTGQFALEASYTGDNRYAAVSSSIPFTVPAITLAPIAPTNRPRGEFITLSATVNPIVDGNLIPATGSVKFVVPSSNGAPDVVIATVPAASATAGGVFTTVVDSALAASNLTVGSYNVVAKYVPALGDVFPALSSNSSGLVIERQNVLLTASVSSNATSYGDQITVQCQIDPAVPGTTLPFGANSFITLYDGSQGLIVLPFTDGQRSVSFVTSGLSAGVHTLQFVYGGDANYQAALSSRMTVTVARSTATISLSTSASVVALGGTVSLTTRVTPPANYPPVGPLGTVTFKANNQIIGVDNVAADGTSRFSYTPSATGNFAIEAVYSGSQQYPSTSAVAEVTSYVFSMAPINPVGGVLGDVVSLKATLSSYDTDIRQAGSVDFVLANGTVLASVPTSAATNAPNGREFFVNINSGLLASRLRVGTISVQAVYNSTGLLGVYPRAYSQVRTFTLSAQPTLLVATPPAAPIVLGSSSVISASVSPSIVATDFPFGVGNVILYEGSTILQTKSVTDAMRTVTFSTASLSVGRHVLSLQYTGDGLNYQGSRSTTFAINIAKVDPDVSVVSSKSVTALGQSTLVTATIGGSVASTGAKPSGVVQFMQGTVVLGSAVLVNGKAALNFAPKRVETASITAKYLGDANFDTDTSNVNVVSVGRAPYMVVAAQGGATIKTFDAKTKAQIASFQPLGAAYAGGFRVAMGDVNGDNVPDFVVTANTGSVVRVYDGQSQKLAGSFTSFASSFALPVSLAIADINGDGRGDIIVAPGGVVLNPQVRVFSGNGYQLLKSMPVFAPGYKGAVSLAVGDVDGDGRADIVCAPASGSSAAISIFSGVTGLALASFADIKTPVGGASVAVGDLTGDGKAEIVLAALSGSSRVTVYDGASHTVLSSFQAFGTVTSGARVTFGTDLNLDGQPELVVGSGVGGNSQVRRFNALNGQLVDAFFAFAAGSKERNGGLFVA